MTVTNQSQQRLGDLAHERSAVFDAVIGMHLETLDRCDLDPRTYHAVRFAALVASDAPPASYLAFLAMAQDSGFTVEDAEGVLIAIAPITGGPRITGAAGNVLRAAGFANLLADIDSDPQG